MSDLFRDFSLAAFFFFFFFFFLSESETSELAGQQVATDEPKQRFVNMPGAVIYIILTRADKRVLKE